MGKPPARRPKPLKAYGGGALCGEKDSSAGNPELLTFVNTYWSPLTSLSHHSCITRHVEHVEHVGHSTVGHVEHVGHSPPHGHRHRPGTWGVAAHQLENLLLRFFLFSFGQQAAAPPPLGPGYPQPFPVLCVFLRLLLLFGGVFDPLRGFLSRSPRGSRATHHPSPSGSAAGGLGPLAGRPALPLLGRPAAAGLFPGSFL